MRLNKGLLIGSLLLVGLSVSAFPVKAEELSSTPSPQASPSLREKIQILRDDAKTQIQGIRSGEKEDLKDNREQRRTTLINGHVIRLQGRYGVYHQRFTSIIQRIQLRIDEKTKAGKDLSVIQTKLNDTKSLLSSAEKLSTAAVADFKAAAGATGDARTTALGKAQDEASAARQTYSQIIKYLQEVIKALLAA